MTTAAGRRDKVLVVDDEFDIRYVARLLLEGAGYAVVEAVEGRAALELLRHDEIDLVLTDVDMPGMDGLALLDHIRHEPQTAALPVIVWSERLHDGLDADATLVKGIGVQHLIGHVDTILRGDR